MEKGACILKGVVWGIPDPLFLLDLAKIHRNRHRDVHPKKGGNEG